MVGILPGENSSIGAVTVTYGQRWNLLRQAMASVLREGVAHIFVVDNGSVEPIVERAENEFGTRATVLAMGSNVGTAIAYAKGIEAAHAAGYEFVLLIDDDNTFQGGALGALQLALQEGMRRRSTDNAVAVSFRPDHQGELLKNLHKGKVLVRRDGFLGFDIAELPGKLYCRLPFIGQRTAKLKKAEIEPRLIELQWAPYSAMLFHKSVIDRHGYPDRRFCLYADDTEFSHRIVKNGGIVLMDTAAVVYDQQISWSVPEHFSSVFHRYLTGGSDLLAYYSVRNQVYFGKYCMTHSTFWWSLNRLVFLFLLFVVAFFERRMERYEILTYAVRKGEAAELGLDSRFPLSAPSG